MGQKVWAKKSTCILLALIAGGMACATANAAVVVIGTQYQVDDVMPEYSCYWHKPCRDDYPGVNAHVYIKNTGGSSINVNDATLAGYSLQTVIKTLDTIKSSASIYYYWDNPPAAIINAGQPVWWRADPKTIPAGGVGQVIVRLMWVPQTQPISIGVVTSGGTVAASVPVSASDPQLASISFSWDRKKVYLTWRRNGGAAPTTIKMDGVDVTAYATTVGDANYNFASTVLSFDTAIANMSYHVYQGIYSDSKTATGSVRTWVNPFVHGAWGAREFTNCTGFDVVNASLDRSVNCMIYNGSGCITQLTGNASNRAWLESKGFGFAIDYINKWSITNPMLWFLDDEPDAEEATLANNFCGPGLRIPCGMNPMGVLAKKYMAYGETLRASNPTSPTMINIDGAFRPLNYYNWGQTVDVLCADPYYQRRLTDSYWRDQEDIYLFEKATYIYAVSKAVAKAAEPNPSMIALYACEWKCNYTNGLCDEEFIGAIWPFPDPRCKRIEAYYSLAAGSKGLAYWWWNTGWPSNGLNAWSPEARALWDEIGRYGNEIKTIAPQMVTSHPVDITLTPSTNVWARAAMQGTDTLIMYAVNDNYYNNTTGFHYSPVSNASVQVTLPSWMTSSPTAFEVRVNGLHDVSTSQNGNVLTVQLGTLDITRLIIITTNANLRSQVQARYVSEVWPKVCNFSAADCTTQSAPPSITSQPVSTIAAIGESASFTVAAEGSTPIYYQWKKNGVNIGGATSATLVLNNVQASDAGNYTAFVSNAHGNVTSDVATLTIGASNKCIINAGFEDGFSLQGGGYIANNWTEWESASGVTVGYDDGEIVRTGSHSQRIRIWGSAGASGGSYQRMPATSSAQYTVSAYIYSGASDINCYLGVDPAGGTNPSSGNIQWSSAVTAQSWTQRSVNVTATSNFITVFLKVVAPSTQKANGYFDDLTPVCQVVTAPSITQQPSSQVVGLGGTAVFTVAAEGSPTLTYQWKKNGANIGGATSATYQITNCQTTDEGNYTCYVANDYGNVTSDVATLTVSTSGNMVNGNFETGTAANPPTGWTTYIQSSKSGNWTIQTAGSQEGSQWQQTQVYNVNSWGGVQQNITGLASGTIYTVSGFYKTNSVSCTASVRYNLSGNVNRTNSTVLVSTTNTNWTEFSATVTASGSSLMLFLDNLNGGSSNKASGFDNIKVSSLPVITQHPSASNVCPGANTSFTVTATGGGTLSYQWQKNSVNLSNGGHYSGVTTTTLSVSGVDTNDAANYRCKVTNQTGSVNSNQAALTVKAPTVITQQPAAQDACPGTTVEFSVAATGEGAVSYQWQKNGANLTDTETCTGVTTPELSISPVEGDDAGNYRCVVTGGCGSVNSNSVALTVKAATVVTSDPTDVTICAGSNAQFSVSATGEGTLVYQWLKDGVYIEDGGHYSGATTATLSITNADTNDEAYYACLVTGGCDDAVSNEALLLVNGAAVLANGTFEASTAANPPSSWTTYIQSSKSGNWTIQTVTPPQGTQWQQTQVYNVDSWGGIRQNVTGLSVGGVYTISGSIKSNSVSSTASVRYNLSGNTNRTNSTALYSTTSTNWVTFSETVTASGSSLMLFLDQLNGAASNKAAGFDNVKVTCTP